MSPVGEEVSLNNPSFFSFDSQTLDFKKKSSQKTKSLKLGLVALITAS